MVRLFWLLMLMVNVSVATAAIDAYPFPSAELQQRYDDLIAELRCPQCLNTNLAGSDAMIAQDLRREVHRLLLDGNTDEEILDFMHERYGDFILYRPRLGVATMILWFSPLMLIIVAALVWIRITRRRVTRAEMTPEEAARLSRLLSSDDL